MRFTEAAYGPIMLVCCWAKGYQEPLYLVSNMASADAACHLSTNSTVVFCHIRTVEVHDRRMKASRFLLLFIFQFRLWKKCPVVKMVHSERFD